jgi:hypothetical protein
MKITITLDPSIVLAYQLRESTRLKPALEIAVEQVIKKIDSAESVYGKLLFNRPTAVQVEID